MKVNIGYDCHLVVQMSNYSASFSGQSLKETGVGWESTGQTTPTQIHICP